MEHVKFNHETYPKSSVCKKFKLRFLKILFLPARTQVFAMLFSPRAMTVVVLVFALIIAGTSMAVYYLYKK